MYVHVSVCWQDFSSLAENQALKQATQAKVDICLEMSCKNFGYKALFVSYGVIQFAYLGFAGDLVPSVTSIPRCSLKTKC